MRPPPQPAPNKERTLICKMADTTSSQPPIKSSSLMTKLQALNLAKIQYISMRSKITTLTHAQNNKSTSMPHNGYAVTNAFTSGPLSLLYIVPTNKSPNISCQLASNPDSRVTPLVDHPSVSTTTVQSRSHTHNLYLWATMESSHRMLHKIATVGMPGNLAM